MRVRGRRGSAGCGSGRRARVAAAPGEGRLGLCRELRNSQPGGARGKAARGQEEEEVDGGREDRSPAAPDFSRARLEAGPDPRSGAIGCLHRLDRTPRLPL